MGFGNSKLNTSTGSTKLLRILYVCQNNTQNEYYKCIIHIVFTVPGSFFVKYRDMGRRRPVCGERLLGWGVIMLPRLITHRTAKAALSLIVFFFYLCVFNSLLLICRSVGHLVNKC